MNKVQLIDKLSKEFGYDEIEIKQMSKGDLQHLLKRRLDEEESKGEDALTALDVIPEGGKDDTETEEIQKPEITPQDPKWTQYVLGKFMDDELDGKNPRVEGLRRVAESLVGDIIEEGCELVAPPTSDNGMRACVKAWFIFSTNDGERRYEALADACEDNCMSQFGSYLTAMADTRAKGRCLRNALKLRRVIAAEEIDPATAAFERNDDKQPIENTQITAIRVLSNRKNVSIESCLKIVDKDETVDIESLTQGEAKKILSTLQTNKKTKETANA